MSETDYFTTQTSWNEDIDLLRRIRSELGLPLEESSVSRVLALIAVHTEPKTLKKMLMSFGTISAFRINRVENDPKKNERANMNCSFEMGRAINAAGFGFIELDGAYEGIIDDDDAKREPATFERSLFVPGMLRGKKHDKSDALYDLLLSLGTKYDQQSIIYRAFNESNVNMLDPRTEKVFDTFTSMTLAVFGQYWSRLHSKPRAGKWAFVN